MHILFIILGGLLSVSQYHEIWDLTFFSRLCKVFPLVLAKNYIPNLNYSSIIQFCDVGWIKPEKEIYVLTTQKARVHPKEILFIDDKEEFLKPAQKLGWNTVRFNSKNVQESIDKIREILD